MGNGSTAQEQEGLAEQSQCGRNPKTSGVVVRRTIRFFSILVSRLKKSNCHLALGVFYASVGLLNEPEREFELLGWIKRVRGEEFRAAPTGD